MYLFHPDDTEVRAVGINMKHAEGIITTKCVPFVARVPLTSQSKISSVATAPHWQRPYPKQLQSVVAKVHRTLKQVGRRLGLSSQGSLQPDQRETGKASLDPGLLPRRCLVALAVKTLFRLRLRNTNKHSALLVRRPVQSFGRCREGCNLNSLVTLARGENANGIAKQPLARLFEQGMGC